MRRALVIDDSQAMRTILGGFLTESGYSVTEAKDGVEGLERLAEAKDELALVLVDWTMQRMDGLAFVRAVRSQPAFDDVKLMVVSTKTKQSQIAAMLEAGANEYVMKPFTRAVLIEKLRMLGLAE